MLVSRRFHIGAALFGLTLIPLPLLTAACEPEHGACDIDWRPGSAFEPDEVQCAQEFPVCGDGACFACTSDFAEMDGEAPCPKRNATCIKSGEKAGQCCGDDQPCP